MVPEKLMPKTKTFCCFVNITFKKLTFSFEESGMDEISRVDLRGRAPSENHDVASLLGVSVD